jgi:hypothetical protein
MKRKVKRIGLNKETIRTLSLQVVSGGATTTATENRTACVTNCPICGPTNYNTCLGGVC